MKNYSKILGLGMVALTLGGLAGSSARAQSAATVVPIIVDTAVPIIVDKVKPKPPAGTAKFEGFVMNANIAQITLKAKGNDMAIQTFALSQVAAAKMQQIVDKGGYQYGDKVTIYYDPTNQQVIKFKGKPSKPV